MVTKKVVRYGFFGILLLVGIKVFGVVPDDWLVGKTSTTSSLTTESGLY